MALPFVQELCLLQIQHHYPDQPSVCTQDRAKVDSQKIFALFEGLHYALTPCPSPKRSGEEFVKLPLLIVFQSYFT
jgi:hypothetical protein